ncbi:MAG: DNA translocase FtsK [Pseudobdellovibrionaceae bacterium]
MSRSSLALKSSSSRNASNNGIVAHYTGQAKSFLARRFWDGTALALMGVSGFLTLSFISYRIDDPSLNTARTEGIEVHNWMGVTGAYTADLFLQVFGWASFALVAASLVWGVRLWKRGAFPALLFKVACLCLSLIFLSLGMARIPSFDLLPHAYAGGSGGALLLNAFGGALSSFAGNWGLMMASLSGFALGGLLLSVALPITPSHYKAFFTRVLRGSIYAYAYTAHGIATAYAALRRMSDPDFIVDEKPKRLHEKPQKPAKLSKRERIAPAMSDDDGDVESFDEIAVIKAQPKAEKAKPKKAESPQRSLSLSDGTWEFPATDLLSAVPNQAGEQLDEGALRRNAEILQNVLADYNVQGEITAIHPGPVVTLYEFEPAPGTKSSRVIGLSDDIARSMSAVSVRASVIPGRNVIGIEIPNKKRQTVYMREMLEMEDYDKNKAKLPLILGKNIGGKPIIADLAKMPHLLVAGTTGSGKSVAVNTMIMSLLYKLSPEQCRFIMIDPKMLELSVYNDIPHLLSEVVTEPGRAVVALKWAVAEMENRYRAMSKMGVRNIDGYNARMAEARKKGEVIMRKIQTGFDADSGKPVFEDQPMDMAELPYIVIIVDEFADLMLVAGKDVEAAIQRLAQMARAAGIHLIMATQRPSVDVITGVIKANFPTRISFQVTSKIDSRTILGDGGAEQLLGMGDMLYMAGGGRLTRVHGPFTSDEEVEKVVDHLKLQGEPNYLDEVTEGSLDNAMELMGLGGGGGSDVDEMYDQAVALVARERKASTSFIQRYLQIGYNRAARIIEEMERQGVVGPANHVGKREVLVGDHSD